MRILRKRSWTWIALIIMTILIVQSYLPLMNRRDKNRKLVLTSSRATANLNRNENIGNSEHEKSQETLKALPLVTTSHMNKTTKVLQFTLHGHTKILDWKDDYWCHVKCITGIPCEYLDEVDLRIVLITVNRPESLMQAIQHVQKIRMEGDKLSLDVWLDKLKTGQHHEATVDAVRRVSRTFTNGRLCMHLQTHHAFITTQWIDTYRPKVGTKEVAIILEDDIDLSPYVWKWYKALHNHFRNYTDIAGFTLKMQELNLRAVTKKNVSMKGPKSDTIFLYPCFQAWGYSPHPKAWRDFQDWYHTVRQDKSRDDKVNKTDTLVPYVPHSLHFMWWEKFRHRNFQESMAHEMYQIYYTNVVRRYMFTVYSNLLEYAKRNENILLCINRKEPGLHYTAKSMISDAKLLRHWRDDYIHFPNRPVKFNIQGNIVN